MVTKEWLQAFATGSSQSYIMANVRRLLGIPSQGTNGFGNVVAFVATTSFGNVVFESNFG